jgi:periplasmic divalent cation tolerance protein
MKRKVFVVLTTCDSKRAAEKLANLAVRKKLSACGQVHGPIKSIYRWAGKVETVEEWMVYFKTSASRYRKLEAVLRENHPYDVPEIIALPVEKASEDYFNWIMMSTGS